MPPCFGPRDSWDDISTVAPMATNMCERHAQKSRASYTEKKCIADSANKNYRGTLLGVDTLTPVHTF